jgi:hypothetical protein
MRFVLVNGRTPQPQSFCALCCEPIVDSYLREIATRFSYCDRNCYLSRSKMSVLALPHYGSATPAVPPAAKEAVADHALDGTR